MPMINYMLNGSRWKITQWSRFAIAIHVAPFSSFARISNYLASASNGASPFSLLNRKVTLRRAHARADARARISSFFLVRRKGKGVNAESREIPD
jgi:hypothetical protein